MRRWHEETALMARRWKVEMGKHGYDWRCPPTDASACHCAHGIGSMRKRTPHGHHKHCLLCNREKYLDKSRSKRKRRAIASELSY